MLELEVSAGERQQFRGEICGDCVAAGLAIAFGRKHVEEGGAIADLSFEDPEEQPECERHDFVLGSNRCIHCKREIEE